MLADTGVVEYGAIVVGDSVADVVVVVVDTLARQPQEFLLGLAEDKVGDSGLVDDDVVVGSYYC